jgi:hypothetical protein
MKKLQNFLKRITIKRYDIFFLSFLLGVLFFYLVEISYEIGNYLLFLIFFLMKLVFCIITITTGIKILKSGV